MSILHLIVHQGMIREFPRDHDDSLLARIALIRSTESYVQDLPWLGLDYPTTYDFKYWVLPMLREREYDLVVLYGIARKACLENVAKIVSRKGIPVVYDIAGSGD